MPGFFSLQTSCQFTWEGVDISYDYAGRNAPEIIANIYGHEHYPHAGNLYLTSQDGRRYRSFLLRICIPNASLKRNAKLETDVLSEGENSQVYLKTAGSAQETAFNVITVNRRKWTSLIQQTLCIKHKDKRQLCRSSN